MERAFYGCLRPTNRSTAHRCKHMPSYRQAGKLAVFPDNTGFPAYYAKETICDQFLILKHPEVQCHHFSIIFMSTSWKQLSLLLSQCSNCNWNVVIISFPRKGNTLVLIFLYKALFKAELPWDSIHTRGIKHWMCNGQREQSKCPPQLILVSVFYLHSWCDLVLNNNVHCVNQKHNKTLSWKWKFPQVRMEEHKHSIYRCPCGLMLWRCSCLRQTDKSPCEEQHVLSALMRKSTASSWSQPANLASSHLQGGPCPPAGKYSATRSKRAFDNLSGPLW